MKMLISSPTETAWRVDPDELGQLLQKLSSRISIRHQNMHSTAHALEWDWSTPDGPIEGSLNAARDCVVLDGDVERCAEFAVWFRSVVPPDQDLLFYDEGYSADVPLLMNTTAEALAAPFLE